MRTMTRRKVMGTGLLGIAGLAVAACGEQVLVGPAAPGPALLLPEDVVQPPVTDEELAARAVAFAEQAAEAEAQRAAEVEELVHAAGDHAELIEITLRAEEFKFIPAEIELHAGVPARITFVNYGRVLHDFAVPEMPAEAVAALTLEPAEHAEDGEDAEEAEHADDGEHGAIHLVADPGEQAVIEFTPTEAGRFPMLCTVPGHAAAGMVGEMIVTAEAEQ